jgi:restriction system protein
MIFGPNDEELQLYQQLRTLFSPIGFELQYSDSQQRGVNPDFTARKTIGQQNYRIGIEYKQNRNVRQAIRHGSETLFRANDATGFDRLLLIVRDDQPFRTNAAFLEFIGDNPTNLEVVSRSDLQNWSDRIKTEFDQQEEQRVIHIVRDFARALIRQVNIDPERLKDMEWFDLERLVHEVFDGIGFTATLTPPNKDGGKDVILECKIDGINKTFLVELKHWRSATKVGQKQVKKFSKVVVKEKHDGGLFLSNYGFTGNYFECLTETEEKLIRFAEKDKLVQLCNTYERIQSGIWNPVDSLEDILFSDTTDLSQ